MPDRESKTCLSPAMARRGRTASGRARGQGPPSEILTLFPFVAALPVPGRGLGLSLSEAVGAFLRGRPHRRWPGAGGPGRHLAAYAFASEADADAFVAAFSARGAQRITP